MRVENVYGLDELEFICANVLDGQLFDLLNFDPNSLIVANIQLKIDLCPVAVASIGNAVLKYIDQKVISQS